MKIEIILQKLGFSKNEAKIYLAALECGLASAQEVSEQAAVKRTTTYSVLSYLVNRGVVGKTKVKGKIKFLAESPNRLVSLISEIEKDIQQALPELNAIYNRKETKPKITFYEGGEAVWKVYEDTLKEKPDKILMWNNQEFFEKFNDPKYKDYIPTRVSMGIGAKRIAGKGSTWDDKHKYLDKKELSETLIVPKEIFNPHIEVNIYNNKVAFMNYAENMSIIIESKAIADAMKQAYELSWKGAQALQ